MTQRTKDTPYIVTHKIPHIEVYQVTDDELTRIEEGSNQVGYDFAFMLTSLSIFVSLLIALATGDFNENIQLMFELAVAIFILSGIYTGQRWFRNRSKAQKVINKIRSRRVDPEE